MSLEWLTGVVPVVQPGPAQDIVSSSLIQGTLSLTDPNLIMSESMFSLAEERHDPVLRTIGTGHGPEESGFVEIGSALSGEDAFLAFVRTPIARLVPGSGLPQERAAG